MSSFLNAIPFILVLLIVEFTDEFVYGAREAAWPLIRDDLALTYVQIGLLISLPTFSSGLIEPVIGILGDIWRRRVLILGGGFVFALAVTLVAVSQSFIPLMIAFVLYYPATGAFVSLSQAALMDAEPDRREHNMARWTFAGSLGIVVGPLALVLVNRLGWSWRSLFWGFAGLIFLTVLLAWRFPFLNGDERQQQAANNRFSLADFWDGVKQAFSALRRKEVLRWLIILEFADLMLDILHGFLALYFVDVVMFDPVKAGLTVAVWTGCGLLGDFLLIPLLEKVQGLVYLRISAIIVLILFPAFLLVPDPTAKVILIGLLGILNSGWYAIPKGQLYSAMPGQSGAVMTVGNLFNLFGGLIPLGLGMAAQHWGLANALWLILLGPIILILGIPRVRSKI